MDKALLETYAHGNFTEKILLLLITEILAREPDPNRTLASFRHRTLDYFEKIPVLSPEEQLIRSRCFEIAESFFDKASQNVPRSAAKDSTA
jgi:hypothetical protein